MRPPNFERKHTGNVLLRCLKEERPSDKFFIDFKSAGFNSDEHANQVDAEAVSLKRHELRDILPMDSDRGFHSPLIASNDQTRFIARQSGRAWRRFHELEQERVDLVHHFALTPLALQIFTRQLHIPQPSQHRQRNAFRPEKLLRNLLHFIPRHGLNAVQHLVQR